VARRQTDKVIPVMDDAIGIVALAFACAAASKASDKKTSAPTVRCMVGREAVDWLSSPT
jgi:hypothetical protein